ncbi:PhlG protein [Pseudomassariella vexata]|uniref:PhlG protein n=1 Tax=Pseudomassariella vexata TaxID=1141098 RepID=A0A1Y2DSR0_9PEZI|nr:PhlG protein [Pseudomassariella vexata]ORY61695.1 PhlG protein [Pseudomassariella vexata]
MSHQDTSSRSTLGPLELVPVTFYPLGTQKHFERTEQRIKNKPYAKYLHSSLSLYPDIIPALKKPINPKDFLQIARVAHLLEPGYHEIENGWCALNDGTAYVASKTRFPGATGEMIDWWFWWHSVEPERYALWYPYNHVSAQSSFQDRLHRDDLSHREKWLGSTHKVTEFIGPQYMKIRIQFVNPAYFGLPWDKLEGAGYAAAVCAVLWDAWLPMKVGEFLHLWRRKDYGLELRSRYWLGHQVYFDLVGLKIPVDYLGGILGFKQRLAGENIAYEQFLHDQIEFTNLGIILPGLFEEFGQDKMNGR